MRKSIKIAGIGIALGAALATGSAFTASNTVPASVAGYGSAAITGATANSVSYTLSADGTTITTATVVLSGDLTGKTVTAGFGTAAQSSCTLAAYVTGTPGSTTATCSGLTATTSTATTFTLAVKV